MAALVIPSLASLAKAAYESMADRTGGHDLAAIRAMSPLDRIRYRYMEGDCPEFAAALQWVTNWRPVTILLDGRHIHECVMAPDGRLLDVTGWTSLEQYAALTGLSGVSPIDGFPASFDFEDDTDSELLTEAVGAMRHLTWAPFNEDWFREMTFRPIAGVDIPPPSASDPTP